CQSISMTHTSKSRAMKTSCSLLQFVQGGKEISILTEVLQLKYKYRNFDRITLLHHNLRLRDTSSSISQIASDSLPPYPRAGRPRRKRRKFCKHTASNITQL
ncbi:hypothetical protein ALC57_12763, partial [Trachymyrmex cornetzi]